MSPLSAGVVFGLGALSISERIYRQAARRHSNLICRVFYYVSTVYADQQAAPVTQRCKQAMAATRQPTKTKIAVIGAGIAGLACAQHLRDHGLKPIIFEKSRGIGGRLATRRTDGGNAFDHGAQYVTGRSTAFLKALGEVLAVGMANHWRPNGIDRSEQDPSDWLVGVPGMNALVKPFADGVSIRLRTEIRALTQCGETWRVHGTDSSEPEAFHFVVCTIPAAQAKALLAFDREISASLAGVSIAPCWALMLAFDAPLDAPFDVWRSKSHDLAWICRNSSKPLRHAGKECWVIHASPGWSDANLEADHAQVAAWMLKQFASVVGRALPEIHDARAHRWRYAFTTAPLGQPFLCTNDRTLFVGGDWCLGARVEYAFESGRAIASAITTTIGK